MDKKNDDQIKTIIILLSCPDKMGIVAKVSNFVFNSLGNILSFEQYVAPETQTLFMRVECSLENFNGQFGLLERNFAYMLREFRANFQIIPKDTMAKPRVAIFVSKHLHCLQDLLWRYQAGELNCEIPLIISNHRDGQELANRLDIKYIYCSVSKDNKAEQEKLQMSILKEHKIDLVVLARYMQILSESFVKELPNQIINIHHSFLPAFVGGDPYRQAYERGVKIIGATSHYVTADLDQGPIIEQDIIRITHKDTIEGLKSKGRDLERLVLARAIKAHIDSRTIIYNNRTIVFGA